MLKGLTALKSILKPVKSACNSKCRLTPSLSVAGWLSVRNADVTPKSLSHPFLFATPPRTPNLCPRNSTSEESFLYCCDDWQLARKPLQTKACCWHKERLVPWRVLCGQQQSSLATCRREMVKRSWRLLLTWRAFSLGKGSRLLAQCSFSSPVTFRRMLHSAYLAENLFLLLLLLCRVYRKVLETERILFRVPGRRIFFFKKKGPVYFNWALFLAAPRQREKSACFRKWKLWYLLNFSSRIWRRSGVGAFSGCGNIRAAAVL